MADPGPGRGPSRPWPAWLLGAYALAYGGATGILAVGRFMWSDEVLTAHVTAQPTLGAMWAFLREGAEKVPPLYFLMTGAGVALVRDVELGLRLPSVLGFAVMSLVLYRLVARRAGPVYGAVALLFPLTTNAYGYAVDARPYGAVMGLTALALLAWRTSVEGSRPSLGLAALAATLAAAVSTHYYAVLLIVPFGLAELARTLERRRVDWIRWGALAASLVLPLGAFAGIIAAAWSYTTHYWSPPTMATLLAAYDPLLPRWPAPVLGAVLLLALARWVLAHRRAGPRAPATRPSAPPLPELVAVLGLAALPVLAWLLAAAVTSAHTPRYGLPGMVGVAVLGAWLGRWMLGASFRLGIVLLIVLGVAAGAVYVREWDDMTRARTETIATYAFLGREAPPGLPIAIADTSRFLPLAYYAPPGLTGRFVYVADPELALRYRGSDSSDRTILALRGWTNLVVHEYGPFLTARSAFLVFGRGEPPRGWLVSALRADGVPLEVRARERRRLLMLARP